jgi:ATP adenylyltransferase
VGVTHDELVEFIQSRMRMSHIYQPVMLMTLLENGGRCSTQEIARAILNHDESQLEYYGHITNNMVGRVLRRHGLVERDTRTGDYILSGADDFTPDQIDELNGFCREKLDAFLEARGGAILTARSGCERGVGGDARRSGCGESIRTGICVVISLARSAEERPMGGLFANGGFGYSSSG